MVPTFLWTDPHTPSITPLLFFVFLCFYILLLFLISCFIFPFPCVFLDFYISSSSSFGTFFPLSCLNLIVLHFSFSLSFAALLRPSADVCICFRYYKQEHTSTSIKKIITLSTVLALQCVVTDCHSAHHYMQIHVISQGNRHQTK